MTTVEVITSVERRRRWSREEKLRIVAETAQPGRTTSQVARDHGIAPGQLFIWRRQLLSEGIAKGVVGDGFAAVEIANGRLAAAAPGLAMGGATDRDKASERDCDWGERGRWGRSAAAGLDSTGGTMITPPPGTRVSLAGGFTDMRKGFDGLAMLVQDKLRRDPFGGQVFVFRGRRGRKAAGHFECPGGQRTVHVDA
jgi:transposase-like protein